MKNHFLTQNNILICFFCERTLLIFSPVLISWCFNFKIHILQTSAVPFPPWAGLRWLGGTNPLRPLAIFTFIFRIVFLAFLHLFAFDISSAYLYFCLSIVSLPFLGSFNASNVFSSIHLCPLYVNHEFTFPKPCLQES